MDWLARTRNWTFPERTSRRQLLLWGLLTAAFMAPSSALARRPASFEAIDRDHNGTISTKRSAAR